MTSHTWTESCRILQGIFPHNFYGRYAIILRETLLLAKAYNCIKLMLGSKAFDPSDTGC